VLHELRWPEQENVGWDPRSVVRDLRLCGPLLTSWTWTRTLPARGVVVRGVYEVSGLGADAVSDLVARGGTGVAGGAVPP
jgi:hypothetical protein